MRARNAIIVFFEKNIDPHRHERHEWKQAARKSGYINTWDNRLDKLFYAQHPDKAVFSTEDKIRLGFEAITLSDWREWGEPGTVPYGARGGLVDDRIEAISNALGLVRNCGKTTIKEILRATGLQDSPPEKTTRKLARVKKMKMWDQYKPVPSQ